MELGKGKSEKKKIKPEDTEMVEEELAKFGRCKAETVEVDAYIFSMPAKV